MNELKELFDFRENSYFYHITSEDNAEEILEEGLLVDGTNILDVDNILFTTAIEITPDMVEDFETLLSEEIHEDNRRGLSAMIIMGCPKEEVRFIVDKTPQEKDGIEYEGIIHPNNIMGYFNLEHEFIPNYLFDYGTEYFSEQDEAFKK